MKLYTLYQNSAGERVRIALNLKGVDYDYVSVGSLAPDDYRAINPQGLMPALEVEGRILGQSTAILEYIQETWPEPSLLPADPVTRAQARGFAQLITSDLHPVNVTRVKRYLADVVGADEGQVKAWNDHWVEVAFTALETTLRHREAAWPFCFGDSPGWADLHLVPQMANGRRFQVDLEPYPLLREIDARCQQVEAFARARPENQPDYPRAG